jgi:hypothetical protein
MADASGDLTVLAAQLAQTAMGPNGGWIKSAEDVAKFLHTIHKTLIELRFPPQQSR